MLRTKQTRTRLSRDIHSLDQQLMLQEDALRLRRAQSVAALKRVSPLWLASCGVVLGVLTGCHGVPKSYSVASIGFPLQRLFLLLLHKLRGRIDL